MKKIVLSMSIGLLLLAGCSKENTDTQIEEQTSDLVYVFNLDGKSNAWETTSINEQPINTDATYNRGNSAHAHGDFPGVEFSGTQNNGGTHGSATVNFGPATFTLETECVMVEGNEAVYGGTITQIEGPLPPGFPFGIGNYLYFKVFDNGQGNNADPDQFYGQSKFSFTSQCGTYTPSNASVWPPTITIPLPWGDVTINLINDVPEPGSIKVNN
jgi:hypothetical protein